MQQSTNLRQNGLNSLYRLKKRTVKISIIAFLVVYTVVTLFPFYVLFIRTFVGTKHATDLWLWPPPMEEASMDYQWGNLSVFYNLDLNKVKTDLGLPIDDYIKPQMTLRQVSEKYGIPEQEIRDYFTPYSVYSGWIVLLSDADFWSSMVRSVVVTALSLVGLNILSVSTGFGLARLRRKDQVVVYNLYLLSAVIPIMMILLPQYLIVAWLMKLIPGFDVSGSSARSVGQLLAVIILTVKGSALSTMIFTTAISSFPQDLEDAAEVDGASSLQYLLHIVLPLLKVPIASFTVISLPSVWNQFLVPYIYLDTKNNLLLPLIQSYTGTYSTNYQLLFSGIFLSVVPLVLIYIMFRNWFVQGAMAGAIKG